MEYKTIAGNYYTITSKSGCTVTDTTGTLSMTVDAGGQLTVQAPSDKLVYDDEQAIVFKANFNRALAELGLLGGGADKLPAGYTRVAFIQGTGQQYINTGAAGNETSEVLCTFERTSAENKAVYTQNSAASTGMLNCFVWGDALENLRYDWGSRNYSGNGKYPGGWVTSLQSAAGVTLNGVKIIDTVTAEVFTSAALVLFSLWANINQWTANNVRMARWALKNGGKPVRDMVAALDPTGTPCMYDLVTREPYRNAGTGQFIVGMTLSQVRALRLPAGGGELTLSLPHEASVDRLAQAALSAATANGWTLTLQYAEAEVPAGYRKLDFLESTGTQIMVANFTESIEATAKIDLQFRAAPHRGLMGFDASSLYFGVNPTNAPYYWEPYREGMPDYLSRTEVVLYGSVDNIDNYVEIGGVRASRGKTLSYKLNHFALFALYPADLQTNCRIYSCSVENETGFVCNLIPCISPDGKLGMYNKVDGTLKENAGSGAFIAGLATVDDVRKLWLPETNGELTVSVPSDTPDSAVEQLRKNNPSWQIAIQYRQ